MSGSERSDAIAPAKSDASDSLPAVPNGDVEPQRAGQPESSESSVPATTDDPGPDAPDTGETHELLEARPDRDESGISRPEEPSAQLVSGDPLLRGPSPTSTSSSPPKSPNPPPPPADTRVGRPQPSAETSHHTTVPTTIAPAVSVASTGPPARRASRGAHVTAPRAAVPPTRPPDQPVATLRPTTVAPVPRLAGRRPRVRRVTRVVRQVDPWSVFKVAAAFSLVSYAIALVAGVLLWNVAYATGTIDNIERGMESTGWEVFELDGGEIFHNAWIGGLFGAVAMTGLAVLVATLFNLITDLVGGIRLTVLEEEVIEKTASPMRRFATAPARRPASSPEATVGAQGAEARVRRARGG